MTYDGAFYRQPSWERRISEIGCGWLPTPTDTSKGGGSSRSGERMGETPTLQGMAGRPLGQGLWPTPKSSPSGPDYARMDREESGGDDLATAVAKAEGWPTPAASIQDMDTLERNRYSRKALAKMKAEGQPYQKVNGGQLNPPWVEWLMMWPIGWTDFAVLAMDKFQSWRRAHGSY